MRGVVHIVEAKAVPVAVGPLEVVHQAPEEVALHGHAVGHGALELTEQGFYDVRTLGAGADSATTLAVNVDLDESDLTPMDPRELQAAVAGRAPGAPGSMARPTAESQAQAQRLWWYLLVVGGLLLAGETLLSNRLSQKGSRVA